MLNLSLSRLLWIVTCSALCCKKSRFMTQLVLCTPFCLVLPIRYPCLLWPRYLCVALVAGNFSTARWFWIPGLRIGSLFYYGSLRLIFLLF